MINEKKDMQQEVQAEEELKIDFLEWAILIGNEKLTIATTILLLTISTIIYSLLVTPIYTSKSTFMIPGQQTSSASSAVAAINAISVNSSLGWGNKSQEEMYVAILNSDTLINEVIKTLKLQEDSQFKMLIDLRQSIRGAVKISIDKKSNFIIVEAESSDANFAAKLANTFVGELTNLQGRLAFASAQERLLFYERAIARSRAELIEAKSKFKGAKEQSAVLSISNLAESTYQQIANKELQINAMSRFSTKQNPEIIRLEAELSALREQLFKSNGENNISLKSGGSNEAIGIEAYREIKSLEMIIAALSSQYKTALMEAFSSSPYIQVIEVAVPPERRSRPQRAQMVIASVWSGLILGLLITIIRIKTRKLLLNNEFNKNINELKNSWFKFN